MRDGASATAFVLVSGALALSTPAGCESLPGDREAQGAPRGDE